MDLDEEGADMDRKKHTPAQKKMYKNRHKIRGSLVTAIPRAEYMKMSDNLLLRLCLLHFVKTMKVARK